ncbi:VOC family protein [Pontibacillus salicampi]|uniref:VOC family protein n=1 Tax=Pontibacillus salicampi TaxID=1449801 RepID=A0ABV6LI84_9BACI
MDEKLIVKVATIEIPVKNLDQSISFYTEMLGLHIMQQNEHTCMLTFDDKAAANVYLVETNEVQPLHFHNTTFGIEENSIIDFYTTDLPACQQFLHEAGIEVTDLHTNEKGLGGFGFRDPNGHLLGMCNIA